MTRPKEAGPPRFYFSFRSPYSWLAYRDLIEKYADVAGLLKWIPFWEPDLRSERLLADAGGRFVYAPMSREKHLYMLQDVRRGCLERGLNVAWPVDRDPVWEVPHLAYVLAAEEGCGPEFIDRVYRARWEEGRNICDRAVIADIAAEAGADPDRAYGAADDEGVRGCGVEHLISAWRDDVFGVPFFILRRDKFWGVDRLPTFVAAVRSKASLPDVTLPWRPPEPLFALASASSSDQGHAGGCG